MNSTIKNYVIFIAIVWALVIAGILFLSGCGVERPPFEVPDGPGVLYETVYKANWLVALSIIGVACSAFAFFNGSKTGLPAVIACLVSLFLSLGVTAYAKPMAIFGSIGAGLLLIASILAKNKTISHLVYGAELLKNETIDKKRASEILQEQQDKTSEPIVKKAIKKLEKERLI